MMMIWNRNHTRKTLIDECIDALEDRSRQLRLERTDFIFKRHGLAEWRLPASVGLRIKYNPRHLPVPIREPDNEHYYLRLAIRRTVRGYRALRTHFPPSPFREL